MHGSVGKQLSSKAPGGSGQSHQAEEVGGESLGPILDTQRVVRPDFFIIGHEKCGTTALYRILRSHPQIYMPDLKEPRYFAHDPAPGDAEAEGQGGLPRTLDAYLELFAPARPDQTSGEASPQYIRFPAAAQRIAALQPAARAIAILREPVSFLRSFHLACVRGGLETERDLRKAIDLEQQRRQGRCIPRGCRAPDRLLYSDHVHYVEQLRRFEHALSREQVHVVIYEDLRRDNEQAAREVLRFLGVDDTLPIEIANSTGRQRKAIRNLRLHRLAVAFKRAGRSPGSAPLILRRLDSLMPPWLELAAQRTLYAEAPPLEHELTRDLRQRFEPEVAALSDYLGRDLLRDWGYRR
jgi:hypothetical protein